MLLRPIPAHATPAPVHGARADFLVRARDYPELRAFVEKAVQPLQGSPGAVRVYRAASQLVDQGVPESQATWARHLFQSLGIDLMSGIDRYRLGQALLDLLEPDYSSASDRIARGRVELSQPLGSGSTSVFSDLEKQLGDRSAVSRLASPRVGSGVKARGQVLLVNGIPVRLRQQA
ncbi:hypothetical protein DYH09_08475 [bacterium CPR1]|nr:hypothetical protein [bacterium CPR1]